VALQRAAVVVSVLELALEQRPVQVVWEQVLELEQEQALELLPFPETVLG